MLRISRTPVTVDSEEYVVFVFGVLEPKCFLSYVEAQAHFETRAAEEELLKRRRKRLRSAIRHKKGPGVGATEYRRAMRVANVKLIT